MQILLVRAWQGESQRGLRGQVRACESVCVCVCVCVISPMLCQDPGTPILTFKGLTSPICLSDQGKKTLYWQIHSPAHLFSYLINTYKGLWGLPWWSSNEETTSQGKGRRFNPWSGN